MQSTYTYTSNNLSDTEKLACAFSKILDKSGNLICLYGDIGSGKTTFVKFLAKCLGISEKVTSPSFVILNEYHSAEVSLYHFDLYRLEKEGIETILDELTEYMSKENAITIIEWAEFSPDTLPNKRFDIRINYKDETSRDYTIESDAVNLEKIQSLISLHKQ